MRGTRRWSRRSELRQRWFMLIYYLVCPRHRNGRSGAPSVGRISQSCPSDIRVSLRLLWLGLLLHRLLLRLRLRANSRRRGCNPWWGSGLSRGRQRNRTVAVRTHWLSSRSQHDAQNDNDNSDCQKDPSPLHVYDY
jgi:hypothetical protein